jgi:uncharacterized membrane protein
VGRREIAWIHGELPRLVEQGLLTREAADGLARHYGPVPPAPRGTPWAQVLLASFGAVLVGGGVILILAHNWELLGRGSRTALVLALLVVAQALVLYTLARRPGSAPWSEASSGLLVAAVGAAIALIAQTYHVPGSGDSFRRAWLWLVVLLPYLTRSRLASLLFWFLLGERMLQLIQFGSSRNAADVLDPWALALVGIPFVVSLVRHEGDSPATAIVTAAAAASIFVLGTVAAVESNWEGLWTTFTVGYLAALHALAAWPRGAAQREDAWQPRLRRLTLSGLLVVGLILSFDEPWRGLAILEQPVSHPGAVVLLVVLAACIAISTIGTLRLWAAGERHVALWSIAGPLAALAQALALAGLENVPWILFNVWLAVTGALTLADGVRASRLGVANAGLATLALLIACRFFDTELSFLARGIGFVVLGAACLAFNLVLMRRTPRTAP